MDHLTFAQLLGNYGEFVGAIAVVATLAYLARQISQSTNTSRADTTFAYFDTITRVHERFADFEFNRLLRMTTDSWNGLSPDEQMQMHGFLADWANKLHMGYLLMNRGVLDQESYTPWEGAFVGFLKTPGVSEWWQLQFFPDDFTRRIGERLSDETIPPITDRLPFLRQQ
jgi:hypothetical protein